MGGSASLHNTRSHTHNPHRMDTHIPKHNTHIQTHMRTHTSHLIPHYPILHHPAPTPTHPTPTHAIHTTSIYQTFPSQPTHTPRLAPTHQPTPHKHSFARMANERHNALYVQSRVLQDRTGPRLESGSAHLFSLPTRIPAPLASMQECTSVFGCNHAHAGDRPLHEFCLQAGHVTSYIFMHFVFSTVEPTIGSQRLAVNRSSYAWHRVRGLVLHLQTRSHDKIAELCGDVCRCGSTGGMCTWRLWPRRLRVRHIHLQAQPRHRCRRHLHLQARPRHRCRRLTPLPLQLAVLRRMPHLVMQTCTRGTTWHYVTNQLNIMT